jgi:hypothetical protein
VKIALEGSYKGEDGHFEWILEANNSVNHRIFIPNHLQKKLVRKQH